MTLNNHSRSLRLSVVVYVVSMLPECVVAMTE
jgi:hypothetical protein